MEYIALVIGLAIVIPMLAELFAPAAKGPTMTTWRITRADGTVMYHTSDNPTNNWGDVVSVEEVKL